MHPLQQRVRRIAVVARRLRWQLALSWVVAALMLGLLVWGTIDYVLHVGDAGVRAIATTAILAATGYVAWRLVRPTARQTLSDLAVAQHIERNFPALGDRLSSSLAFLSQDENDATAGSASLRRAVVADTMARTDTLDFHAVLDARPARRALFAALGLIGVAGILAFLNPGAVQLVLTRTMWPWTTAAWPRRHQLKLEKAPDKLALGADFEVAVLDENGKLPESVTLLYWFDGEREDQAQAREMKLLSGKMVHRLENVTRPFKYRAIGGDDESMPWNDLRVLEPPRVVLLEVRIHPPAYTGWPTENAAPDFRALEGSRIELTGQVDKPITAAELKLEGSAAPVEVPIAVGSDGLSLTLPGKTEQPWLLSLANAYTLKLTSTEGLTSQDARHEIRVVPDRPPAVAIEKPADNTLVTPQAIIPVRVLAKDDFALHRIELRYLRSDKSEAGEQVIELFAGPERVLAVAKNPLGEGVLAGDSRLVEFAWKLAEIPDLAPGVTLTWHVAALDYKPQTGLSPTQRLAIISAEELEDRIAQRQAAILAQLHEVLRQQREARSQIASLETQLQTVNRLGKQDLDDLLSSELNQRQVQRAVGSETDGLLTQIALLLSELDNNRLDSPDVARRMNALATELKRLTKEPLAIVERDLTAAQKVIRADLDKLGDVPANGQVQQFDAPTRDATQQALTSVGQQQDVIVASLERLLGDLSEWDNYRRFAREMSRLRADQEAVHKETQALQPLTLSKNPRDLSPVEQASLKRLAQRQTELSRQFDKLLGRMTEARGKLGESQPLAAETLADALDAAKRLGISSQMLDTARGIEQNQLGNASEGQQEVANALGEMLDILSNRKEHELGRRVKQLREATNELTGLEEQLKGLRARTAAASKIGNEMERKRQLERLTKEHQRLAEEVQRLARRLERLQSEKAGASAGQASEKIGQAGESSKQGAGEKALEDNAQAQERLKEAKQQLQQDLAQAQQDLFFEQVAKLEQAIQGLVQRQTAVIAETERLEGLKTNQQGEWTPSQRTSVRSLSEQQRDLVGETTAFAQKLAQAEAFGLALQGAVREMGRAAARLERFQTDGETQNSEKIALARLSQLLEALKPEPPMPPEEQPKPGDGGGGNPQQPPPGDALTLLAELKLLKLMQTEINRRTTELEKLRAGAANLPAEQEKELGDLSTEQGQLADLVQNIVARAAREAQKNQPLVPENGDEQPKPPSKNPLDDELNKALDNELLPGNK